jgi:MFS family permease
MIFSAVFLIGFSTLAFEVLLTRIFSISQWNHLSFMVISIALFGFAASGTYLSIYNARRSQRPHAFSMHRATAILVVLYTAATILAFVALNNSPLDYFRLPVEPIQSVYLVVAYLLLALPFFFSGLIVALAYTRLPEKTGLTYFATMCGSAGGAIFPALLLPFFSEGQLVVFCAIVPLVLMPSSLSRFQKIKPLSANPRSTQIALAFCSMILVMGSIYLVTPYGDWLIRVRPSPYKALSQVLQFPETRIEQTFSNIRGRTDLVTSPYIRFAPGLSLRYQESILPQEATFRDGDHQLVLYPSGSRTSTRFSASTLSYSGYDMRPGAKKALLVLQGGGTSIPCALFSKIQDVTIVIKNPSLAKILRAHYRAEVVCQPPRAFMTQTSEQFDIIQLENWGTAIPGSGALDQEHLFTTDAFLQYLQHLTPDGVVIISRRLLLPPADCLRLWASAYEGLKLTGAPNPADHLAILRNWDTFTLLVSKQPLQGTTTTHLKKFAENLNFDIVFLPRITSDQANRFNKFDEPYHSIEVNRLAAAYRKGQEKAYFRSYLLDIQPQSDNRPFPGHYLKWPKAKLLYQSLGSRLYALLMSGEVVVLVVLIEALVISGFLLFLPLVFVRRRQKKISISQGLYFLGVGAGFMFIELFFIKKYILLFGDAVISFSVVVCGVLIFSSLGGAWIQKKDKSVLKKALPILIAILLLVLLELDPLMRYLLGIRSIWQYIWALLILFPIGFLMGLPFTIGMRDLLTSATQRAYAWSANGCASVITAIVSAQIALIFGISSILGCAIAAYLVVILSWQQMNRVGK